MLSLVGLAVVMGLLLFVPAGSIRYWQGWVYLAIFFGASLLITIHLIRHDPALLQRRMRGGPTAEKQPLQKLIMLFASLGFIALLVIPALDHRLHWSEVSLVVVAIGDILVAAGFYFIFLVRCNIAFCLTSGDEPRPTPAAMPPPGPRSAPA